MHTIFQNPLYSTLFVKGYLGKFLCVCVGGNLPELAL